MLFLVFFDMLGVFGCEVVVEFLLLFGDEVYE